jgi:hypothetical protein
MREGPVHASAPEPPVTKTPHPQHRELWIVLIALALLLWAPRLRGPLDLRWDGAVYYVLGTSLAEGKGYRLLNEPGEVEAVQYPPLQKRGDGEENHRRYRKSPEPPRHGLLCLQRPCFHGKANRVMESGDSAPLWSATKRR